MNYFSFIEPPVVKAEHLVISRGATNDSSTCSDFLGSANSERDTCGASGKSKMDRSVPWNKRQ